MNDAVPAHAASAVSLENVGTRTGEPISVEISTRFLEHFSEQLYSSPQKAFEELISNGWDAGASCVDVRISPNLASPGATMCVLDNGASMDADGLRTLWRIAFSPKRDVPTQHGRPVVGKFGIGKLATYVLANKLTYICRASDGVIRRVTMDYGGIDQQKEAEPDRLLSQLPLELYELTEGELETALSSVHDAAVVLDLIRKGVPKPVGDLAEDEFCAPPTAFTPPPSGTWTLVVLSDLKPTGRELKQGVLRRMLEAALPFGSEMAISLNGQLLASSKVDAAVAQEWIVGPELGIDHVEVEEAANGADAGSGGPSSPKSRLLVTSGASPTPFIELPDIGRVTGRVKLFVDPISGGKSEDHKRRAAADALRLALSRIIIITKDQGASLGRDISHSRPHRIADASDFDVEAAFARSVRQVRKLLADAPPPGRIEVRQSDARRLWSVENESIDAAVTSPPYLNAIDYMRGHRLSLVWFGHTLSELRAIRSGSVGAERGPDHGQSSALFGPILDAMIPPGGSELISRHRAMLARYAEDTYRLASELARVLKPGGRATLVVGNSCLKGTFIRNSDGVRAAAAMVGLDLYKESERELPTNSRYLPMPMAAVGPLGKRMRTETVLTFTKQ